MARQAKGAVINLRVTQDLKDRLQHHADRITNGNASLLAHQALNALVNILDQKEKADVQRSEAPAIHHRPDAPQAGHHD